MTTLIMHDVSSYTKERQPAFRKRLIVRYDTIRYDTVYLTCSKELTGSQFSLPHGTNKICKRKKNKSKLTSMIRHRCWWSPGQCRFKHYSSICLWTCGWQVNWVIPWNRFDNSEWASLKWRVIVSTINNTIIRSTDLTSQWQPQRILNINEAP